jgi:hypothetical protein
LRTSSVDVFCICLRGDGRMMETRTQQWPRLTPEPPDFSTYVALSRQLKPSPRLWNRPKSISFWGGSLSCILFRVKVRGQSSLVAQFWFVNCSLLSCYQAFPGTCVG